MVTIKHSIMTTVDFGDFKLTVSISGKGILLSRKMGKNQKVFRRDTWDEIEKAFRDHEQKGGSK